MATKTQENITLLPYRERIKLVRERMSELYRCKTTPLAKPAKVAAAEKVYRDWQAKAEAHEDAQRSDHRAKLNAIQDAMIVGDMTKAVALLQQIKQIKQIKP